MVTFEERVVSTLPSTVTKDPFYMIKTKEKPKSCFGKYFVLPIKIFY